MGGSSIGTSLLERDGELTRLREVITSTPERQGGVVVIEGPAGIGKTRLLEAARGLALDAGLGVAWGRGSELEREHAFGLVRQLLEPVVMSSSGSLRDGLGRGAAALALPLFLAEAPGETTVVEPDYATLHGLYWLVAELADRQPLALCVDDVQWADLPSLRFLTFAGRRIESLAVTIFVTLRTGEVGTDPNVVSQLLTEPGVRTLRPRSLSGSGVEAMARDALGLSPSADLVRACLESTGGNPFYLKELLGELVESGDEVGVESVHHVTKMGSAGISALLLRRLAALPGGAEELARAVAVLGDGTQLGTAAKLVELEPVGAEEALGALVSARLLVEQQDRLAFTHPIVRSSVYASLAPRRRSDLHVRAAQQLERERARVEEVARHLLHAQPGAQPGADSRFRAAAHRSLAVGAPETAAGFLRRALLEPLDSIVQAETLLELGRAEMRAGLPAAVDRLRQVMDHPAASPAQRGLAALDLGEFFMHAMRGHEGIPFLEAGLDATRCAEPDLSRRIEATLVFNAFGGVTTRRQLFGRLRDLKPPPTDTADTDPRRLLFAALAYDQVAGRGSASDALTFARQCLSYRGPIDGSTEGTAIALALCGMAGADRPDEAEPHADRLIDIARKNGSITVFSRASSIRALIRWRRGHLQGAESDARAVLALESDPGLEVVRPLVLATVVSSLTARGELEAAEATAKGIDRDQAADSPTWRHLLEAMTDLRLAKGDARGAVEAASQLPTVEEEWGAGPGVGLYEWRWRFAAAHAAAGEEEVARAVADEQLGLAERFGSARALGIALRTSALFHSQGMRIEMLQTAIDYLPRERSAVERARALVELGAALSRAGHRSEAREPLQEGLELGRDHGATRLAMRAHTELRAAGARPRSPLRTGLDALTASERRVAEMVASGLTNAEAAQALFVTVKTVEMHLSNVYRKLNIGARTELREALAMAEPGPQRQTAGPGPLTRA